MKVLVVCQYYYPENFQITPICEQLVKEGFSITVLTGLPNYPTGIIPEEYKNGRRDEFVNGVHIIRCNEIGRKRGAFYLGVNYLSYMLSAAYMVGKLDKDFDLVFVYQLSPVLMAIPGILYSKKNKVPVFLYCCDLWPESIKMYIKNERNIVFKLIDRISKKIYSNVDKIACQSSSFLAYFQKTHNISNNKLIYLPAFADETYLTQDFSPVGENVDFVFLGNLGIAQNLISVLKAVEKIKEVPGFVVHFVGDGSVLNEMKEFVCNHGLQDVVMFYGRRPVEEMPAFYKLADACLVSLKADNQTGLTLPSKVQGYMAAGKTIIGMIDGSTKEVVEESGCGVCVGADDIDGFASLLKDFILHKEKYDECGKNGRVYFKKHFCKGKFMERLRIELESLIIN